MGLDFSYLLYFKRDQLWDVLNGVASLAVPHHPPTTIRFPDGNRSLPLDSWMAQGKTLDYDAPELQFSTVLLFEEDDEIFDYIASRDGDNPDRSPPIEEATGQIAIGYIYLTIYNDLSTRIENARPSNLILFDFGTTGTRMSMLFSYSTSIRSTFARLLDRNNGLCGIFNRESDGGELFWLQGRRMTEYLPGAYLTDQEIKQLHVQYGEKW